MPGAKLAADLWISEYLTPHDIWQHGVDRILAHCKTPHQDLYVVESGAYGKALVLDGKWQTCTGDEFLYHEPLVHTPFVLHGRPRRVLIAGGADGGAAREALKWHHLEQVLIVDIDFEAVEACRKWLPEIHQGAFDDPRVRVEYGDAFDVIQNTHGWDVIIADLTDPIENGPAYKLFTREFFAACHAALTPDGIFVNQAGSMSPPFMNLLTRTVNTISAVFCHATVIQANVPTYGSPWGLALASKTPLDMQPNIKATDALLESSINGDLRMFDGQAMLGILQIPKHVRTRLANETAVYSLADPPRFFGCSSETHV